MTRTLIVFLSAILETEAAPCLNLSSAKSMQLVLEQAGAGALSCWNVYTSQTILSWFPVLLYYTLQIISNMQRMKIDLCIFMPKIIKILRKRRVQFFGSQCISFHNPRYSFDLVNVVVMYSVVEFWHWTLPSSLKCIWARLALILPVSKTAFLCHFHTDLSWKAHNFWQLCNALRKTIKRICTASSLWE